MYICTAPITFLYRQATPITCQDYLIGHFYRYVSKEEFYAKVKEKYDQTCLSIVLKRLVNDDFRW